MSTNTHDNERDDTADTGDTLHWQLRALRRDEAPGRDLWPGIAAALTTHQPTPAPRRRPWLAPAAIAASLLLVVGVLGWQLAAHAPFAPLPPETLVQREAAGLTRSYEAALQEFSPVSPAGSLQPAIAVLDRDVALIRDALEQAPHSRLLLEQLRRTYSHRLALAQRVAYS